ncbi:F0F1 ATP synthase subunit B [uncultured Granulicatella sp.]|uniref:F0F1 ATP synthase subunit B n=1 Tax=uncultured Granulicatella sp. TaxID=316089 RepID=UPI0028D84361|nr:F0F1 ATP synthase subunit B [uncultured Granulicatella sp.]
MFQYMLTVSTVLGDTLVVLISIILLLFLVKYFAWDKIEAMLEARRQKISKDLDEAEKKRKAAEEIQANAKEIIHNAEAKGQEILNTTREAASKMQDEMIKEGRDVVSRMKLDGQREVDSMKQRALAQMQDQIVDLSVQLASQILNKELTEQTHQDVIESFIEGLES